MLNAFTVPLRRVQEVKRSVPLTKQNRNNVREHSMDSLSIELARCIDQLSMTEPKWLISPPVQSNPFRQLFAQ